MTKLTFYGGRGENLVAALIYGEVLKSRGCHCLNVNIALFRLFSANIPGLSEQCCIYSKGVK